MARPLAIVAVAAAFAVAVSMLLFGGSGYTVTAEFENAGQLVEGNEVRIGSNRAGSVKSIELGDDYRAEVEIELDEDQGPLREGSVLTVRVPGLAGLAGRYVSIEPGPKGAPAIPDGGEIPVEETEPPVDVDQVLSALDARTVSDLRDLVQRSAAGLEGQGDDLGRALVALNPALSQTSQTLREAVRDKAALRRLLRETADVVSELALRRRDLATGTAAAAAATGAVADERQALARTLELSPPVLRQANTAFVNLRAALADFRPAIPEAIPVADGLALLLPRLRPLAAKTRRVAPRIRRLAEGPLLALLELLPATSREGVPLAADLTRTLDLLNPAVDQLRAYAPDLTAGLIGGIAGNQAGYFDSNGQYARIAFVGGPLTVIGGPPPGQSGSLRSGLTDRCPGGAIYPAADGSNPYTDGGRVDCDPSLAGSAP
jgi:phospholipid/cholesterol/gamma-HCH transport system substrate-binding protein